MLVICATVAFSTAIPLLLRDGPLRDGVLQAVERGDPAVLATETSRMEQVLKGYPMYRIAFVAAALAAVVLVLFFRNANTLGLSTGLLVFAATGFVVDHYSETRAKVYHERLSAEPH
jgi:hypothetical protein